MIKSIRKATDDEWDRIVNSVDSAIYFQTREWFEIWADCGGFEIDTKLILFDSGKKVLLPLVHLSLLKGLIKASFFSPKGMGGAVASHKLNNGEQKEFFGLLKKLTPCYFVISPYDELMSSFAKSSGQEFTQVLDLSKGFARCHDSWSVRHIGCIKQVLREGVVVEPATTEKDWRRYFEIYLETLGRWGGAATNRYPWALFETMFSKRSKSINLWLAKYQGAVIGGALCFYHNKHVAYWHGATAQKIFGKLNVSHLLQYQIIKDACDRGFLIYDFMPSGGLDGVVEFKRRFGSEKLPVHIYASPLMKMSGMMRNHLRNSRVYKLITKASGL